jgi:hypothetical protein
MRIDLSGHKFTFPQQCACCGAAPQTTLSASATKKTGKRVVHTDTKSWAFPYCSKCTWHVRAAANARTMAWIISVGSLVVAAYLAFGSDQIGIGLVVAAIGIGSAIWLYNVLMSKAKMMCCATCAAVKTAVGYYGWQGACHMFEVVSSAYALAFMLANQTKLVNVRPEVWHWLQANGYGPPKNQPQSARRYMT